MLKQLVRKGEDMKKRGSVLVYVIAITSILMVLGTVVSSAVVSTTKYNEEHSQIIDLELAAKSGLNIFLKELTEDINHAKNQKDISLLPSELAEIDSGITAFNGIKVTKKITRDTILDAGVLRQYKYTIYSKATENQGSSSKEVNQVITVNINGESGKNEEVVINPINFLNIKGNLILGGLNKSESEKIVIGGTYSNEWGDGSVKKDSSLSEIQFNIKDDSIDKFLDRYKVEDIIKNNIYINQQNLEKYKVDYNDYNIVTINLNHENKIIYEDIDCNGKELYITLNNSELIVDGDILDNRKLYVEMNNSKLIINGNIESTGQLDLIITNGEVNVNGYIRTSNSIIVNMESSILNIDSSYNITGNSIESTANQISITMNHDNVIDLNGGMKSNNNLDIFMYKNNNIIIRNGDIYSGSISINMSLEKEKGNSKNVIKINGNINATNKNDIDLKSSDKIYIVGNIVSQGNYTNLKVYNKSQVRIDGYIKAQNNISIDASESSVAIKEMKFNDRGSVEIKLKEESALIQEGIYANNISIGNTSDSMIVVNGYIDTNSMSINLINSPFFINGYAKIHSLDGTLNNSIFIVNGDVNYNNGKSNSISLTNQNKSCVYIVGDLTSNSITLNSNENINPDEYVINKLVEFAVYKN